MSTTINFPDSPSTGDTYAYGDVTYEYDGTRWYVIATPYIQDGSITHAKLHAEFKAVVPIASTNVDWDAGLTFTKTLSSATVFIFSNLSPGVKFLELTGDFAPTFPTGFTYIGGERAVTGSTVYQVVCTNAATPIGYYSIYKDES